MKRLARASIQLGLVAATLVVFDLVAYIAVPERLTTFASSYRKPSLITSHGGQPAMTRGGDPRHYFQADERLGFDIKPGARMMHAFGELDSEIFANSLGCFDRNELDALRAAGEYHYFAGDSFTWGFAEYDSKFATAWERSTGKVAAKCGVPHTGQAAQLEKFRRTAAAIGRMPATVFVGFYVNDPANDAAFPHTTVIEGYMADTVFVRDGVLVRADPGELRAIVEAGVRQLEAPLPTVERLKRYVWVYSLSANLLNHARLVLQHLYNVASTPAAAPGKAPAAEAGGSTRPTSKFGGNLYWYGPATMKSYASDPKTAANRTAIQAWAAHARENGYRLVFLLFPPADGYADPELYSQVRTFLDANGIEHLDFAPLFRAEGLQRDQLYWKTNGHWNPEGNRVVGRLLAARYR